MRHAVAAWQPLLRYVHCVPAWNGMQIDKAAARERRRALGASHALKAIALRCLKAIHSFVIC
jgi:hypothetical protein